MSAVDALLDSWEAALAEIKAKSSARGLTLSEEMQEQMAYELAQRSQPGKMQYSLSAFSKYNGESAPDTFVTTFVDEASLCGITDESMLMRTFPSLMTGKAQAV